MLTVFIALLIISGLYIFTICPDLSRRERMQAFHGTMFAHRGYHNKSLGIPENSMAAFRSAISHGYGIELDVHITSDGELIVFHDDTLNRMCRTSGRPENMTARTLQSCRLLDSDQHIPLFSEVLRLVNGQVPLLIELKIPDQSVKICEKTYELLRSYHGTYLVQSFNTNGLHWFLIHAPEVLRGQLSSRLTKDDSTTPWILRFITEHLLGNFFGKPDFISYKLADLPTLSTTIIRKFFGTTTAVWTLRTKAALLEGQTHYDIQIFENNVNFINK